MKYPKLSKLVLAGILPVLLAGCAELGYYAHTARGQLALVAASRPVPEVLQDAKTSAALRERLNRSQLMRDFASRELDLPDNTSYRHFVQLPRPYALWNVVATPELSLQPIVWCFPVAGCVSYRGYYDLAMAQEFAAGQRALGHDVQVSGIPAYSTLGWFNDPILSSFVHYADAELARLMFHELAHQVVYVAGDSQFNESFATAVEQAGVARWLACHADAQQGARYAAGQIRQQEFLALLQTTRQRLQEAYQSSLSDSDKRTAKQAILQQLQTDYQVLRQRWGGYAGYDRWFAEPIGNAHLTAVATYHELVPGFLHLLRQHASYRDFYAAVRRMSALSREQRYASLKASAAQPVAAGKLEQGPCQALPLQTSN